MLALVEEVRGLEARAEARSESRREKVHARGQLTPRERIAVLLDPGSPFLELRNLHGYLVDEEDPEQALPGASSIGGIGFVAGTRVLLAASDSGIAAGAITTSGMRKTLRLQDIAYENRLPMINLTESGGADLPFQSEIFVRGGHGFRLPMINLTESAGANLLQYRVEMWSDGGRTFANMARHSAAGLPVITVLHGSGTAGGAYVPAMSDENNTISPFQRLT